LAEHLGLLARLHGEAPWRREVLCRLVRGVIY